MKNKREQGSALIIVIGVVLVAVIGFLAWRVLAGNKTTTKSVTKTASVAVSKKWTEGGFAVAGTYADADVVQVDSKTWRLYYAIQPEVPGQRFEVYSATSTDGKKWTQEPGTRKVGATFPEVVKLADGRYRMYYQQAGVLKSAISSDGLSFSNEAGTRIDTTNSAGLTFDNVAAPTVTTQADGSYIMVYRGTINTRYAADTPNPNTQLLMWATSADGLNFTKKGIAVDSRTSTLRGQLDGPDIVKWDDGKLHVFATTYAGVYEFVFDGSKFDAGSLAYNTGEVAPPGDPTTAKINGVWYMYYGGSREKNGIRYASYQ